MRGRKSKSIKFRNDIKLLSVLKRVLKIGRSNFKIFYISLMVTTRDHSVVTMHKNMIKNMIKTSNHTDTVRH